MSCVGRGGVCCVVSLCELLGGCVRTGECRGGSEVSAILVNVEGRRGW